jgi:hypothetical protein
MDLGGPRRYGPKVTFALQTGLSTNDGFLMTRRNDSGASCPQVGADFSQTDRFWRLARHWYDGRLERGYLRREPAAAAAYFRDVRLHGAFWGPPE